MTQTITRPDTSLIEAVRGIGTATIHEAGGTDWRTAVVHQARLA